MKKKHNILRGMRPAVLGLALMAAVYAGTAALRIPGIDNKFEFAGAAGIALAWLPVLYGLFLIRRERVQFRTAMFMAAGGVLAAGLHGALAGWRFLGGMGEQTFLQVEVMFFGYLSFLAMMCVYWLLLKGIAAWNAVDQEKPAGDWKGGYLAALVLIFAATLYLPLASMFDGALRLGTSGAAIAIIFFSELYLCLAVLRSAAKGGRKE